MGGGTLSPLKMFPPQCRCRIFGHQGKPSLITVSVEVGPIDQRYAVEVQIERKTALTREVHTSNKKTLHRPISLKYYTPGIITFWVSEHVVVFIHTP